MTEISPGFDVLQGTAAGILVWQFRRRLSWWWVYRAAWKACLRS
jgi:hypothetical protein